VKGRFPPDLLVVILGPVQVVAVAFGSLIFHAQQLGGSVAGYGPLILGVLALGGMLFFRKSSSPVKPCAATAANSRKRRKVGQKKVPRNLAL
jgi:hypothetical protein